MTIRLAFAVLAIAGAIGAACAQEHKHGDQTIAGETARFYDSWMKRNTNPPQSCCSRLDCYATEARFRNGHWQAKRREDGKWLWVPDILVEQSYQDPRESPDGQNHLCAPPPNSTAYPPDTVFCFTLGSGT